MNRLDIIREVSRILIDKREAELAVRRVFDSIAASLDRGEKVVISGFGTFTVKTDNARKYRNPKTGETVMLGPVKRVRFKSSPSALDS